MSQEQQASNERNDKATVSAQTESSKDSTALFQRVHAAGSDTSNSTSDKLNAHKDLTDHNPLLMELLGDNKKLVAQKIGTQDKSSDNHLPSLDIHDAQSYRGMDQAERFVAKASAHAYDSSAAAYMTVANKLADDPHLLSQVTTQEGSVTSASVSSMITAEYGLQMHNEEKGIHGPRELSHEQMATLDLVRTHIGSIAEIAAAGATAGLSAAAIAAFTSKNIGKELADKDTKTKSEPQDHAKTIDDLIKKLTKETPASTSDVQQLGAAASASTSDVQQLKGAAQASDRAAHPVSDQVGRDEFATVAKQVIAKLDTEHSGQVTKAQLAKALEDPSIVGKEAQALAALYQNFDRLHNLSGHEGLLSSASITPADLDKFNQIQKEQSQRIDDGYVMKNWAHRNLDKFGGSISSSQIEKALADPKTSAEDKKALAVIQKHWSELGHWYERSVNTKAFDDYAANTWKDTTEAKTVNGVYSSTYEVNQGQQANICHDLYADKNNPLKSIVPDAVKQGSIGDCYFVSSLAAVAKANPQMIKDAIKDNGDGTYTVTFPGAKGEPITVKAPTEAEQGLYNHGTPQGLWASVMEKAYGQYCQNHFWRRGPFNLGGGYTPQDGADGGGRTSGAMQLLTGHDTDSDTLMVTRQSTTARKLEEAFSGDPAKAVTCGINNIPFMEQTADKFYYGHAYSITGFVPDGKGGGMVTIRNPWGGANDSTSGTITIPLEKFMKNFSDITYEQ